MSEIRPDWGLSTPGLREAWDAGDFSRFHGRKKKVSVESASIRRKEWQRPFDVRVLGQSYAMKKDLRIDHTEERN
jgi:hypothetical protein